MYLPERIIKTTRCLLKKPCTALYINNSLPCMNGYNYIHWLRVRYGINVLDRKRDGDTLKEYYIPESEKPKVWKWLASFTGLANQNIKKQASKAKRINKGANKNG